MGFGERRVAGGRCTKGWSLGIGKIGLFSPIVWVWELEQLLSYLTFFGRDSSSAG